MIFSPLKIKDIVLKNQLIDEDAWDMVEEEAKRANVSPLDILFGRKLVEREYFTQLLAKDIGVERINLRKVSIPANILKLVPEKVAIDKQVIPFEANENVLKVAMVNPQDIETQSFIASITNRKIEPYFILPDEIRFALTSYQKLYVEKYQNILQHEASSIGVSPEREEATATRILDNLLGYAMGMNASDVHLEVMEHHSVVRFRVDGVLKEMMKFPNAIHPALIAKIKVLSNMQLDEHFRPQDGRMKTRLGDFLFDIRVSVMPTMYGEKAVMRLLASGFRPSSLDELGANAKTKEMIDESIHRPFGMVLIAGPTGSGKTTTLYAILQLLNNPEVNICTIKDPIETELTRVTQPQINPKVDLTFATGLRSFLRQDPDIIMVGEMRDFETADIGIRAALTGHLLLSTIHTNDAPSTFPRLLDLGIPNYLVAATINIVLAQRLARKICLDCIYSEPITKIQKDIIADQLRVSGMSDAEVKAIKLPEYFYKGKGCKVCGFTGYRGRVGLFEAIAMDDDMKNYLTAHEFSLQEFTKFIRLEKGYRTMFEDGLDKVIGGITTLEEVLRVTKE